MSLPRISAYTSKCMACHLRQQVSVPYQTWQQVVLRKHSQVHNRRIHVTRTNSKLIWTPNAIRNVSQLFIKQKKCLKVSLCLLPFSFFKRNRQDPIPDLCPEVLANIPKEVFSKEILVKKKGKHNFVVCFILRVWEGMSFFMRVVRICITFGPLLFCYPLAWLSSSFRFYWWSCMLFAMEYTGPTFIKLGQWAGTRRDLFSAEFCDMCTRLHDSTRQHAFYITKRKLRKAFGKKWRRIFEKIEKVPIGSGCIAQVRKVN